MNSEAGTTDVIQQNLKAGELVDLKMYNTLVTRVSKGEVLSDADYRKYQALHKKLKGDEKTGEHDAFKSLHAVVQYLEKNGYKIKKSSIYNHQAAGKIRPNKDGQYLLTDVEKYAQAHLRLADGTPSGKQIFDTLQKEQTEVVLREKNARARHWELRAGALEGKLVPRETFENELAARAAIFRADGENFFRGQASEITNVVSGDHTKIPDLVAFCLDALEEWLSRYLQREEFKVDTSAYEQIFEQADRDEEEDDLDDPRNDDQ